MRAGHSHSAHPHRLRRESCNSNVATCGLCHGRVNLGEIASRCTASGCSGFFLHGACYRYPDKIKHFSGHRLALAPHADVVAGGGGSCDVCTRSLDGLSHVYGCRQSKHRGCAADGFRAHPRCANLPQHIGDARHAHPQLVLRQPRGPPAASGGSGSARRCLACNSGRGRGNEAWSYQCSACQGVELCLPCAMGRDDTMCCTPFVCGGGGALTCAGFAVGKFLEGLVWGCTGIRARSLQAN